MRLEELGWDDFFQHSFAPYAAEGCAAGRVALAHRGKYVVLTESGELDALPVGRLRQPGAAPVVGDWVVLRRGSPLMLSVLPRKTQFSRKQPGEVTEEQVFAANIDVLFVVCGLDGDFNPRRIERYLVLVNGSGAVPVIVLNKADLHPAPDDSVRRIKAIAPGTPVVAVSALTGAGIEALPRCVGPARTAALAGSSGAGKSTIVNRLLGVEIQRVQAVRESDSRGRHTTTHRELIRMPGGWWLIDQPGLRELQLWAGEEDLDRAFTDVAELAAACRFRDCRHDTEPGCAVRAALEVGGLDEARLLSYRKLQRELNHLETRLDERSARERKARERQIHRAIRKLPHKW